MIRVGWLALVCVIGTADLPAAGQERRVQIGAAAGGAVRVSISYDGYPSVIPSIFVTNATDPVPQKGKPGEFVVDRNADRWTLRDPGSGKVIVSGDRGTLITDRQTGKASVEIKLDHAGDAERFYGSGGGRGGAPNLPHEQGQSVVAGGFALIPYYWSSAGYAVMVISGDDNGMACWDGRDGKSVTWDVPGKKADLYLMPAATLYDAAKDYAELSGAALVPPRWTFGYLQSRWGWKDRAYITDAAKQFIDRKLPVDAFIFDFEWFTPKPDYELSDLGSAEYHDFGWNAKLFDDPAGEIAALHRLGIHVVPIRKPRLGNSGLLAMARGKNWILPQRDGNKSDDRCLDFGNGDCRDWYARQIEPLLKCGIDGWWDDEGELTTTTYYGWNEAEAEALAAVDPARRPWTMDRSFAPGLQRLGAAAWTADIASDWKTLAKTPGDLLNWSLAGMDYGACDIGGFLGEDTPELLARWMEAGVFFPVMRAHSELRRQPRFPWLYGPAAEGAIRKALDLRYRLIPMYYSLAHLAHETGAPLMRPLVMEFPNDPRVYDMTDQWLIGRGLMAAPVMAAGEGREVYLPDDDWYVFGSKQRLAGGRVIAVSAGLDEIPMYVRAGTIVPLGPVIQHTDELPGGPLEVEVYPGKDAEFTLVEDDGQSTAYLAGVVRRTQFHWDDAGRRLSWKISGGYEGKDIYRSMQVVVFDSRGIQHAKATLGGNGSVGIAG